VQVTPPPREAKQIVPQAHDHRFINEQGHARAHEQRRDTHGQTAPQAGRNSLTSYQFRLRRSKLFVAAEDATISRTANSRAVNLPRDVTR